MLAAADVLPGPPAMIALPVLVVVLLLALQRPLVAVGLLVLVLPIGLTPWTRSGGSRSSGAAARPPHAVLAP